MGEIYTGVKFNPIKLGQLNDAPFANSQIEHFSNQLQKILDVTPKSMIAGGSGNISCRIDENTNAFVISATTVDLSKQLDRNCLTVVHNVDDPHVEYFGNRLPSSESPMHGLMYQTFPKTMVIFHLHPANLQKLISVNNWSTTLKEYPYGTFEIGPELTGLLRKNELVAIQNHGIVVRSSNFDKMIEIIRAIKYS